MAVNESLKRLADAHGVATDFWDWKGSYREISEATVIKVLAAMGVDASSPQAIEDSLQNAQLAKWRQPLPPTVVVRQSNTASFEVHVIAGQNADVSVQFEQGGSRQLRQLDNWEPDREIDGGMIGESTFEVPADLPLGYHRIALASGDKIFCAKLIVVPEKLQIPDTIGEGRIWGFAAQLYSVRSRSSWGIGDLTDLSDLAVWSASQLGADYVLVNPLHAANAAPPMDPSPYLPTSRLFVNPMYIRPEQVQEYSRLSQRQRQRVADLLGQLHWELRDAQLIQRDESWQLKRDALKVIFDAGMRPARRMMFEKFMRNIGIRLTYFATWSVLCQYYGNDWRRWPEQLQQPASTQVAKFREEHSYEIEFEEWLQWIAHDQLSDAQQAANDAGMKLGIISDLAVGVSAAGSDTWIMKDTFATNVSVGAPPDSYNQIGQDWGQPPWRPDRLAQSGYEPFIQMVRSAITHSGGVRIDHILGMFRLWWIPQGASAAEGTYVRYNHEAMIGIIMLEAQRASAIVIGEDLGTVEPWVRDYLSGRGILGTSVLWFEMNQDGNPKPPEQWRELCMASVTTHDLPPTAGYLDKIHVKLRHELGLLTESLADESAHADHELALWRQELINRGLLAKDASNDSESELLALHKFLMQTPARVLNVALVDAVGDKRVQNQPGTWKQYPNWQIPLSDESGKPLDLDEIFTMKRPMRLAAVMDQWAAK